MKLTEAINYLQQLFTASKTLQDSAIRYPLEMAMSHLLHVITLQSFMWTNFVWFSTAIFFGIFFLVAAVLREIIFRWWATYRWKRFLPVFAKAEEIKMINKLRFIFGFLFCAEGERKIFLLKWNVMRNYTRPKRWINLYTLISFYLKLHK